MNVRLTVSVEKAVKRGTNLSNSPEAKVVVSALVAVVVVAVVAEELVAPAVKAGVQAWRHQVDHTTAGAEAAAGHAALRALTCSRAPSHLGHDDSSTHSECAFPSPS